jgi:sodium/proline symporter
VQVAFPPILVALFGVTVLAAAMSTSDGIFVVISTSIANDIYRKFLVPRGFVKTPAEKVDANTLRISRIVTVLTGVLATLLVIDPPEFIGSFIWIGISGVASATLGPILVGLFFPSLASANAAKVSVVTGLGSYLVIHFIGFEESTLAAGAWAVCVGVAAMFAASLFFRDQAAPIPGSRPEDAVRSTTER